MVETPALRHASGEEDVRSCFPLMRELRPGLGDAEEFVGRIDRQQRTGYRLMAAWRGTEPVGLAGYRVQENLLFGKHIFVEDLVSSSGERSRGIGALLLQALVQQGRDEDCRALALGTGLGNVLAQRFYYRHGLLAKGIGFSMSLR